MIPGTLTQIDRYKRLDTLYRFLYLPGHIPCHTLTHACVNIISLSYILTVTWVWSYNRCVAVTLHALCTLILISAPYIHNYNHNHISCYYTRFLAIANFPQIFKHWNLLLRNLEITTVYRHRSEKWNPVLRRTRECIPFHIAVASFSRCDWEVSVNAFLSILL